MAEIKEQKTDQVMIRLSNGDYLMIVGAVQAKNILNWGDLPEGTVDGGGVGVVVSATDGTARRVTAQALADYVQAAVNAHTPYIDGETGTWWAWDDEQKAYVDSGVTGTAGPAGKSAYELAVAAGYAGTEAEWLASLKGADGATGPQGPQGEKGEKGDKGDTGAQGPAGPTTWAGITDKPETFPPDSHTHSIYTLAQAAGYTGSEERFTTMLGMWSNAPIEVSGTGAGGAVSFPYAIPAFTRVSGTVMIDQQEISIINQDRFYAPADDTEGSRTFAVNLSSASAQSSMTFSAAIPHSYTGGSVAITLNIVITKTGMTLTYRKQYWSDYSGELIEYDNTVDIFGSVTYDLAFTCP